MLRIRIDGGALTSDQLRVVADIATTYGRDVADITDRQNVQLHWIRIEDVPAIWEKLEAVGLSTTEACGDTPRVMLGCPLEGVASRLGARRRARRCARSWTSTSATRRSRTSRASSRPRSPAARSTAPTTRSTTSRSSASSARTATPGFDLWVGGGLSTNPRFAERLGVFVRPDEVQRRLGGRRLGVPRLRLPPLAQPRAAEVPASPTGAPRSSVRCSRTSTCDRALPDGPPPPASPAHRDHTGIREQNDGVVLGRRDDAIRTHVRHGAAPRSPTSRTPTARPGSRSRRSRASSSSTCAQDRTEALADELETLELSGPPERVPARDDRLHRHRVLQARARRDEGPRGGRPRRNSSSASRTSTRPITINVNGCPNSCARFQVADIGFKGMVARGADGEYEDAFQVHLGGQMGSDAEFGRKFRGLKVTAEQIPDYAERVLRGFLDRREGDESFASYVTRADEDWLL